ncbi:N-acetylmuramoyl-L-alanine amidase [Pseudomonas fluorescens]
MYKIDCNSYRNVKGFSRRVRFLVMHYTAEDFTTSVTALTGPNVSAHYLIPDPSERTYADAGFKEMSIFNLVDENERAWHAGASIWAGRNNLNDTSIGIEIVNLATDKGGMFTFPPYHPEQIAAIKQLAINILQRYPDISPVNVVGHSDISSGRKSDPGSAFPWKELYAAGVGAWYDDLTQQRYCAQFKENLPPKSEVVSKFSKYGYDTSATTNDNGYMNLIRAFQLHFRPKKYDGVLDAETAAALYALVDKYF